MKRTIAHAFVSEVAAYLTVFPYALLFFVGSIPFTSFAHEPGTRVTFEDVCLISLFAALPLSLFVVPFYMSAAIRTRRGEFISRKQLYSWPVRFGVIGSVVIVVGVILAGGGAPLIKGGIALACFLFVGGIGAANLWNEFIQKKQRKEAEPGATDNPDDAQRLREDH